MTEQPQPMQRGPRLLAAHMRSLDPATLTAQERLAVALGPQLARKLLFALAPGRRQSQSRRAA
jgi:hypothetical protein